MISKKNGLIVYGRAGCWLAVRRCRNHKNMLQGSGLKVSLSDFVRCRSQMWREVVESRSSAPGHCCQARWSNRIWRAGGEGRRMVVKAAVRSGERSLARDWVGSEVLAGDRVGSEELAGDRVGSEAGELARARRNEVANPSHSWNRTQEFFRRGF